MTKTTYFVLSLILDRVDPTEEKYLNTSKQMMIMILMLMMVR